MTQIQIQNTCPTSIPIFKFKFKGEAISEEAKAAVTTGDLWSLFFKEEMLDKIVNYTNDKICETIEKNGYTTEHLNKNTYIKHVDKVPKNFLLFWPFFSRVIHLN
jgi:hypothetical protein